MSRPVPKPPPASSPLRRRAVAVAVAVPRPPLTPPAEIAAELLITYWNHVCPRAACWKWAPHHRPDCGGHPTTRRP